MARTRGTKQRDNADWTLRLAVFGLIALSLLAAPDARARAAREDRQPERETAPDLGSPSRRGPAGNGSYPASGWGKRAAAAGLRELWRAEVGEGFSSVTIMDGLLWTLGSTGAADVVVCLDALTGREVWAQSYPCGTGAYPGPQATAAVDGFRLYALSREGELHCYGARDGALLWNRQLVRELGATVPTYGIAASPVLVQGGIIVALNNVVALLDGGAGAPRWSTTLPKAIEKSAGSYSTPVPFSAAGRELLAFLGEDALYVLDLSTGTVMAHEPWLLESTPFANVADPVVRDNLIFVSNGYNPEGAVFELRGESLLLRWSSSALRCLVATPVLAGGHLYGLDSAVGAPVGLVCAELETGKVSWRHAARNGSLIVTRDELILLTETGKLVVVTASPAAYEEVLTHELGGGVYWTPPVLWQGRLYCRSVAGRLVCLQPAAKR